MQLEQVKPNKPSFGWVVFWFALAIVLAFVAAVSAIALHFHKKQTPPYSRHPQAQLVAPDAPAHTGGPACLL